MNEKNTNYISSVKIAGFAGQGVKSTGHILTKLAARLGYSSFGEIEYPSLIRGGHNVMQVSFSRKKVSAPQIKSDLIIALNQNAVDKHLEEIKENGAIIYNSDSNIDTSKTKEEINSFGIPLTTFSEEVGGNPLLINIGALGATVALFGSNLNTLEQLIEEEFGGKGEKVVESNKHVAKKAHTYILENHQDKINNLLKPIETLNTFAPQLVVSGNEAVALGAISAGLEFSAIYPMSPISGILHTLAANQDEYGYIYRQPEDELAAINMNIGASFAGARVLTATSGGGFCLMTEGYGLAGMVETPVVIVEGQRGSPGTGIPTWSEQGDLLFVINAHQGDFPRIVLTPGDTQEAFDLTMKALNIADKYQTPVVVLIDKNICDNEETIDFPDISEYKVDRGKFTRENIEDFKRYEFSEDGISQRSIPGSGNFFIANSDEHDEKGYSTEEIETRNKMMEKRMQKLKTCAKEDMEEPKLYGPENADITLVSWGSNKGSIIQALESFENVNYLHITWMNPFPAEAVENVLTKAKHVIDVECNYSGQLAKLIRQQTGIEIQDKLLKYDGRHIYPQEIEQKIKEVLKGETQQ
jgi:2-oxoglutarate ferredoxin oxidoreductase subunit alpha